MSRTAKFVVLVGFVAFQFACSASMSSLRSRAAFDLKCNETDLQIVDLDGRTKGVSGCGARGVYVEDCQRTWANTSSCTWVLNSSELPPAGMRDATPPPTLPTTIPTAEPTTATTTTPPVTTPPASKPAAPGG